MTSFAGRHASRPECCSLSGSPLPGARWRRDNPVAIQQGAGEGLRLKVIQGGSFQMGTDTPLYPQDGEGPPRSVTITEFHLSPGPVTNREFARFVEMTGYRTDAERIGWSFVFEGSGPPPEAVAGRSSGAPWWLGVEGAAWSAPEGPGSSIGGRGDHPVVHVSWWDAVAYSEWVGGRLPTEAEWEYAAKGGARGIYPWGDELVPEGRYMCNTWQGAFPQADTGLDGYRGTSPVGAYPPNQFDLWDMIGNVWEWCADWYSAVTPPSGVDPKGPANGAGKVTKGGSFLCHESYCARYRPVARTSNTPDSSTSHMGFRVAADAM